MNIRELKAAIQNLDDDDTEVIMMDDDLDGHPTMKVACVDVVQVYKHPATEYNPDWYHYPVNAQQETETITAFMVF